MPGVRWWQDVGGCVERWCEVRRPGCLTAVCWLDSIDHEPKVAAVGGPLTESGEMHASCAKLVCCCTWAMRHGMVAPSARGHGYTLTVV
nr:hypothetical protein CFP56_16849 [Quercus suber]